MQLFRSLESFTLYRGALICLSFDPKKQHGTRENPLSEPNNESAESQTGLESVENN